MKKTSRRKAAILCVCQKVKQTGDESA